MIQVWHIALVLRADTGISFNNINIINQFTLKTSLKIHRPCGGNEDYIEPIDTYIDGAFFSNQYFKDKYVILEIEEYMFGQKSKNL